MRKRDQKKRERKETERWEGGRGGVVGGQSHPPPSLAPPAAPAAATSEWLVLPAPLPLCHLSPPTRPCVTRAHAKQDTLAPECFLSHLPRRLHAPTLSPRPCQLSSCAGHPWGRVLASALLPLCLLCRRGQL